MSLETEKEIVIIESQKSEESFLKFKNRMLKIGIGVAVFYFLLFLLCGAEDFGFNYFGALLMEGIVYFIFWLNKTIYENVYWIITNKGLTQTHRKSGVKTFIPTNHISSVTHIKEVVQVITINTNQPMRLSYLKNASELKKCLDDLIYKTEKQKEVVVLENTDSMSEIKKYKELLDSGIITQEEFDTKKKQLLDL